MDYFSDEIIARVASLVINSKRCGALTGAGISVESGIPAFRGSQGLWEKYNPDEYATIDAFIFNPGKVWTMLRDMSKQLIEAKPNPAHYCLAELEKMVFLHFIITQNVDGLHQLAGSRNVIEFHGNGRRVVCFSCKRLFTLYEIDLDNIPPRCHCGGILKPDVIFFGENIPYEALKMAEMEISKCDLLFVIGTSASVLPACTIPYAAKAKGARIIEINPEKTGLTDSISDYFLKGKAGEILPKLMYEVKRSVKGIKGE